MRFKDYILEGSMLFFYVFNYWVLLTLDAVPHIKDIVKLDFTVFKIVGVVVYMVVTFLCMHITKQGLDLFDKNDNEEER